MAFVRSKNFSEALGYLNKQDSGEKVIDAIRTVLRGERYVSAAITERLVSQALGNRSESPDPIDTLTDREQHKATTKELLC